MSEQRKIQHLFLRAGFSETPVRINELLSKSLDEIIVELFETSKTYKDINYLPYPLNEREEKKGAGGLKLANLFIKSFSEMEQLNEQWIFKMTYTKAVLREKMVFFWHNHFATSVTFSYLMQQQNNTIRKYALGKFGDLLHAIAKDPAMIIYLNNQQNVKDHPNENFAREVMELFTLGEGNYTEDDIKEAARCFTGWTITKTGEFEFDKKKFDEGEKTFMGEKGFFTGEDILNKLLFNKQTARYITSKIYREFVNPVLNESHINELTDSFYNSGYDIELLMRQIFSSDWFYAEENIGVKIASPVELIVRFKKNLSIEFKELKYLINYQKALGQLLFFPPNVSGWKGHTAWIDSASLLLRLNTITYINEEGLSLNVNGKPAFEAENKDKREQNKQKKLTAKWDPLVEWFENKTDDEIINSFIQCELNHIDKTHFNGLTTREKLILVMTLPEFQLI